VAWSNFYTKGPKSIRCHRTDLCRPTFVSPSSSNLRQRQALWAGLYMLEGSGGNLTGRGWEASGLSSSSSMGFYPWPQHQNRIWWWWHHVPQTVLNTTTTETIHWDWKSLWYDIRGSRHVESKTYVSVGYKVGKRAPYWACLRV
jgi:hypothetical protein